MGETYFLDPNPDTEKKQEEAETKKKELEMVEPKTETIAPKTEPIVPVVIRPKLKKGGPPATKEPEPEKPMAPSFTAIVSLHMPLFGRFEQPGAIEEADAALKAAFAADPTALYEGYHTASGEITFIAHGLDTLELEVAFKKAVGGLGGDAYFRETFKDEVGRRQTVKKPAR